MAAFRPKRGGEKTEKNIKDKKKKKRPELWTLRFSRSRSRSLSPSLSRSRSPLSLFEEWTPFIRG
jgi:hypothetical protein